MPRRTILFLPVPADVEDLVQVLTDVARGWAAAKAEVSPDGMLAVTASRRRAQRPAPGEEPDDEEVDGQRFAPGTIFSIDVTETPPAPTPIVPQPAEPPLSGQVIPAEPGEPLDPYEHDEPAHDGSLALVD
jgi:hypothetical protein